MWQAAAVARCGERADVIKAAPGAFSSFHVRTGETPAMMGAPAFPSREQVVWNGGCHVLSRRISWESFDTPNTSLPCPTRHVLTLRCVELPPLTVHLMFSALHRHFRAFGRPKSIILPCILEGFHGAR